MDLPQLFLAFSTFWVTLAFGFPLTNREQGAIFIDEDKVLEIIIYSQINYFGRLN